MTNEEILEALQVDVTTEFLEHLFYEALKNQKDLQKTRQSIESFERAEKNA